MNEELKEDIKPLTYGGVKFHVLDLVSNPARMKVLFRWVLLIFGLIILGMFLPWTQNVPADGQVVSLNPDQQFQSIYSVISGRLYKWDVHEGQHVKIGDTIAEIKEVKSEYFDPKLLERTEEQLASKKGKLAAYRLTVEAYDSQVSALNSEQKQKISQVQNKLEQTESKLSAAQKNLKTEEKNFGIATAQLRRADSLFSKGIYSRTDWEAKLKKFQDAENKVVQSQNYVRVAENDYHNSHLEQTRVQNEFLGKLNKLYGERAKTETEYFETQAQVAKLENKLSNLKVRSGFYYITAFQEGYITKILKKGVGNVIKEGDAICTIMPAKVELAIALYVKPIDLPLIQIGEKIAVFFDGWPAFIFSGWPELSTGTFKGEVYAIDKVIDREKSKYRVIVIPDPHSGPWPKALRVGGGARGLFLLNDVTIGYEIWRQINGFPPDFYEGSRSRYKLDEEIDKKYHTK